MLILATCGFVGMGIVIQHQSTRLQNATTTLAQLTSSVEALSARGGNSVTTPEPTTNTQANTPSAIQLPVVAFGRPGLLNNTAEGLAEKARLQEKLINPFIDYYKETGGGPVSLYIEVPASVGMPYVVTAIFCGNGFACGGTEEFLFGNRERAYGFWQPPCDMEGCTLSEAFKKKYPAIQE